jgi:hypothetical protein
MLVPPVAGAVKDNETVVALVTEAVGAAPNTFGTVVAVIELLASDVGPLTEAAVLPVAVKVYAVADCRPVTVTGLVPVAVNEPGVETTV